MKKMNLYIDTHDKTKGTFPEEMSKQQFSEFYAKYNEVCAEEGVISIRAHVGLEAGRAFCFNMAPSVDAVAKVHDRMGLPYDSITEVALASPGDLFFSAS